MRLFVCFAYQNTKNDDVTKVKLGQFVTVDAIDRLPLQLQAHTHIHLWIFTHTRFATTAARFYCSGYFLARFLFVVVVIIIVC